MPHLVAFYNMLGEGCQLLPRSSTGSRLLDLRPEADDTFDPFGDINVYGVQNLIDPCKCTEKIAHAIGSELGLRHNGHYKLTNIKLISL